MPQKNTSDGRNTRLHTLTCDNDSFGGTITGFVSVSLIFCVFTRITESIFKINFLAPISFCSDIDMIFRPTLNHTDNRLMDIDIYMSLDHEFYLLACRASSFCRGKNICPNSILASLNILVLLGMYNIPLDGFGNSPGNNHYIYICNAVHPNTETCCKRYCHVYIYKNIQFRL